MIKQYSYGLYWSSPEGLQLILALETANWELVKDSLMFSVV